MHPIVVADSGPLIALACCDQLPLLAELFACIHLPQAVLDETTADLSRPGAANIARFATSHAQIHASRQDAIYAQAIAALDEGESQALSLACALQCGVLMDERRGRAAAKRLDCPCSVRWACWCRRAAAGTSSGWPRCWHACRPMAIASPQP